ncbi:MAG: hypothetical protein ACFFC7_29640 [Candidatus Hermodarchaeota archaeon]
MIRRRSRILKEVYPHVRSAEDMTPRSAPPLGLLGVCKRVVAQRQAEQFDGFTVDLFSATVFLQVFNKLDNKCIKTKLLHLPPVEAVSLAWMVIGATIGCNESPVVCAV